MDTTDQKHQLEQLLDHEEKHKLVIRNSLKKLNGSDVLNQTIFENYKDDIDMRLTEIKRIQTRLTVLLPREEVISVSDQTLDFMKDVKKMPFCVFSDASKRAYGFTVYVIQGGVCTLLFAKAKVAPLKAKTLPTLELLAAFLALKCMNNILKTLENFKIIELYLAVDSQIVLTWLLSKETNNKSIFVKNRLKDITCLEAEIKEEYNLSMNYKYVPSKQNPADLITRGLTTTKFKEVLSFWCTGPDWLTDVSASWPDSDLGCLSADNKRAVLQDIEKQLLTLFA